MTKVCTVCKLSKQQDEFYHNPTTQDNRMPACSQCMSKKANARHEKRRKLLESKRCKTCGETPRWSSKV